MIIIYGSTGYMGSAIVEECDRRNLEWSSGGRQDTGDFFEYLADREDDLVINAAAFIPQPTVDECKNHMPDTILGNVVWPTVLARQCETHDVPLIHLSTACIYDEQRQYTEDDEPTRGWDGHCGFYVGTKLLAERIVREYEQHYILRLRVPFDEQDHPRNYLTKLASFDKVYEHENSLTHRGDFAKWVLDLWENRAPFGTYHCVNTGTMSARTTVVNMAVNRLLLKMPEFVKSPHCTGATLSNEKLASVIGPIRSVQEAVTDAVLNWKKK